MRMEIPPASAYRGADFFVDSEIPLRVIHIESGPAFPEHTHDFHELVLVYRGMGIHRFGGVGYEARRGDAFLIPRGASHSYAGTKDFDYINVVFDAGLLFENGVPAGSADSFDPSGRTPAGRPARLSAFGFRDVLDLVNRMDQELLQRRLGYRGMIRGLFAQAWCLLVREFSAENGAAADDPRERVRRVMRYLENEGGPGVSVADMASEAGMSVRNFHRVFRDLSGVPPSAYVNGLRIERARVLLEETEMTVTQIAGLVGFDDSNYFAKIFRSALGVSPRQYRSR